VASTNWDALLCVQGLSLVIARRPRRVFHGRLRSREVIAVQQDPPAALELALRLRQLRQQRWPDARLTQAALASALGAEEPLSAATVSSWESPRSPKLPPRHRVLAYARFFATRRSVDDVDDGEGFRLVPLHGLTEDEKAVYKTLEAELLGLRNAASNLFPDEEIAFRRSWHFTDSGPATLVCSQLPDDETGALTNPANPNYTELLAFADLDALMEVHGHIRAENPMMDVFYKAASSAQPDDLSGHVIIIGGIGWNEITGTLSEMAGLPIRQVDSPKLKSGDIFTANVDGRNMEFWPKWRDDSQTLLAEDVGLLARVSNPLNSSRTLTICNGIYSRGVYGAVRSLTDARLRDSNERYIAEKFGNSPSFAILMSVKVIEGKTMTPDFNSPGGVLYQWHGGDTK
jgi:Helix-turn-helix domain